MSKQSENFKELTKGNPVSSIKNALIILSSSVRNELMKEFDTTSIEDLAFQLSIRN